MSVNEKWEAAFIESTAGAIHKVIYHHSLFVRHGSLTAQIAGKFAIVGRIF